jgi:hypothetical protein
VEVLQGHAWIILETEVGRAQQRPSPGKIFRLLNPVAGEQLCDPEVDFSVFRVACSAKTWIVAHVPSRWLLRRRLVLLGC